MASRGPLRFVILAATGEDIRRCSGCACCDPIDAPGMDLTLGELLQAAVHDDVRALTSQTLWASEPILSPPPRCQEGIDVPRVIRALREEAVRQGLAPSAG